MTVSRLVAKATTEAVIRRNRRAKDSNFFFIMSIVIHLFSSYFRLALCSIFNLYFCLSTTIKSFASESK